eukprot:737680-Pleurochrysis_carterae.AAC.2
MQSSTTGVQSASRLSDAAKSADNDADALFALRRIKKLPALKFGDTLAAHHQAVANDPARAAARAGPPPGYESRQSKLKRVSARARHDGYARYRTDVRPLGSSLSDHAMEDGYSRYDTGEPHPIDGDGSYLVGYYIDRKTGWQMYRCDENAVQPENGNKAYFDPAAAAAQRERWRIAELTAAKKLDERKAYADDIFSEAPPTHPDDLTESDPTSSRAAPDADSDNAAPRSPMPTTPITTRLRPLRPPARSTSTHLPWTRRLLIHHSDRGPGLSSRS